MHEVSWERALRGFLLNLTISEAAKFQETKRHYNYNYNSNYWSYNSQKERGQNLIAPTESTLISCFAVRVYRLMLVFFSRKMHLKSFERNLSLHG